MFYLQTYISLNSQRQQLHKLQFNALNSVSVRKKGRRALRRVLNLMHVIL